VGVGKGQALMRTKRPKQKLSTSSLFSKLNLTGWREEVALISVLDTKLLDSAFWLTCYYPWLSVFDALDPRLDEMNIDNQRIHRISTHRRNYNRFVTEDTIEDYALRYVPTTFRRWSELLIANTSIGGISCLVLEAIGASIAISYGFSNALLAILVVGLIIFLTNLPISYYAAKYNLDIDLLTRGAGFGYVGSTITSLIYASFTFIFFALEAAIMAQALELYFHLPVAYGYVLCSLLIIPLVFFGVTQINRLEAWTQPLWLVLLVAPYAFIYHKAPEAFHQWLSFAGKSPSGASFDLLLFGAAATVSFPLIVQIGEQVDYLRFMPDKGSHNHKRWWFSLLVAGPGWIILGVAKQLGGIFLAFLAISQGISIADAHQPTQMYLTGFGYVFSSPDVALAVTVLFVVVSQIKINVTNAYAGSLAWSNFFSRLTHSHPGRVVWLIFNIAIALLLMELNVFVVLEKVLGLYANVAVAWIGALTADLVINKPLNLSPAYIEFRRAHLHRINPVGTVAMLIASIVSISAFLGAWGPIPQAFSPFIALTLAIVLVPVLAVLTKSRFYLALRPSDAATHVASDCVVCSQHYSHQDTSYCPEYNGTICSLCCTLDARCDDACKPKIPPTFWLAHWFEALKASGGFRFFYIFGFLACLIGVAFGMAYIQQEITASVTPDTLAQLKKSFLSIYFTILILLGMVVWWIVLTEKSYRLTQDDLDNQNLQLQAEITERRLAQEALQEKEERLSLATLHNGVGIWDFNPKTQELIWDESMFALYHLRSEDFSEVYEAWEKSLHPDDRDRAAQELQIALAGGRPFDTDFRVCWPNGEVRYIKAMAKVFRDDSGEPVRMLGTNVDITGRKVAEKALKQSQSKFSAIFNQSPIGIALIDSYTGKIYELNRRFAEIVGRTIEQMANIDWMSITHQDDVQEDLDNMARLNAGEIPGFRMDKRYIRPNGSLVWINMTIVPLREENTSARHLCMIDDITAMKEYQQQLEHIAHYDVLTSLPNRVLLADRLQQAMIQSERHNQSLAVAYLDLDGFKAVNDIHGHEVGDELLKIVSKRMQEAIREEDTLARIGGDEFVAVLINLEHMNDFEPVLARLLKAAAEPVMIDNVSLQVSVSIGITLYPRDDADADLLMRHADQAMYMAKQLGKNRYYLFDISRDEALKTQRDSLEHIRHALNQREFVLYYQPKVNMKTGEVIGAEGLIRWQHPELGLLPPANFLPFIEGHPLSVDLGEWVIDTALAQMSEWQAKGLNIPVSVNVGAYQLQQQDFVSSLSALLAKYPDVNPNSLELEILETSALENITEVTATMRACLELGVHFALDDFGTGYSSLTYLRHLPADILKIDQSFVRDMLVDSDAMAIVNGVIGLGTTFHRQVIAEGVETVAHGTQLLPMGCVLAQGYGIARPMPASDLPNWVANWTPHEAWQVAETSSN